MINGVSDAVNLNMQIKQEPPDEGITNCSENVPTSWPVVTTDDLSPGADIITEYNKRKESDDQDVSQNGEKRRKIMLDENHGLISQYNEDTLCEISAESDKSPTRRDEENKCYICDIVFTSQDELVIHMTLKHKRKNNTRRQIGRFARHTCQVCFARFRTLKDFFNHTSCHSVRSDISATDDEIGTRISKRINKNNLQHLFLENSSFDRNLLQPTFKCDQCRTVFVNRDSYAMHVMMSVKNQSCKPAKTMNAFEKPKPEIHRSQNTDRRDIGEGRPNTNGRHVSSEADLQIAYYEDITSKTEKDEYLQLFLEKSNLKLNEQNKREVVKPVNIAGGKACFFCDEIFHDKDTLAMHVMSCHSNDIAPKPSKSSSSISPNQISVSPCHQIPMIQTYTTYPSNELMVIRADVMPCQFCDKTFTNRDALAMHVLSHSQENDGKLRLSKRKPLHTMKFDLYPNKSQSLNGGELSSDHNALLESNIGYKSNMFIDFRTSKDEPLDLAAKKSDINQNEALKSPRFDNKQLARNLQPSPFDDDVISENKPFTAISPKTTRTENLKKVPETLYTRADSDKVPSFRSRCTSLPDLQCPDNDKPFVERCSSVGVLDLNAGFLSPGLRVKQNEISENASSSEDSSVFVDKYEEYEHISHRPQVDYIYGKQNTPDHVVTNRHYQRCTENNEEINNAMEITNRKMDKKQSNPMEEILWKNPHLNICKFCGIIFPSKTLFYLHMGLHNVNNPWQCNMCGKSCTNVNDFSAHVIHFD